MTGEAGGVTAVSERATVRARPPDPEAVAARPRWERPALAALLLGTAALYLVNLGDSGWANGYYAAAVQAGSQSWTAALFGATDAAGGITVDKTPAAVWVMVASARVFGFNPWSMLVPQALMGVAAVAVLWAAVRRISGPGPALLAGAVLALTPAAALMFRFNNPDALLVLALVMAGYATLRALDADAARYWLPLAGVAVGIGFLAKMLQVAVVLPVFAAAFLVCADLPWRDRLRRSVVAGLAAVVSAGWYLLLVSVWPADRRPYIGGSQHNSILELALGYNGLGRLTGAETGGLGNPNHDVGWDRLLGMGMGLQIGWLLPAAVIALIGGLICRGRAPRTDRTRAALLLWGGWLVVVGVTFSYMQGIVHPYYTVALAPAVGATLATGVPLLWARRDDIRVATTLAGMTAITAILSYTLLQRNSDWMRWLGPTVLAAGLIVAVLLLGVRRLAPPMPTVLAGLAVVVALAGPGAYSIATAATPHTGAIPSVGPANPHGRGGPAGFLSLSEPGPNLVALLAADEHRWAAATVGSNNAAGYQLAAGTPVFAVGGFNGTDPAPTLEQFQRYVADNQIGYFLTTSAEPRRTTQGFGRATSGSDDARRIADWVAESFGSRVVDGVTVYQLAR
ncbi:glycosyl transferase [Mycolicibacterium insubricum]|uniref:ArnT family glycosyltransferase n=1 Tax=Mycolicibacterium insubricum TaxID=444597 RepID=UPI00138C50DF|nr:glycosyl transferase [Mycolicibacterium insubricum]